MINFYQILGLKPGASQQEIKRAYFTLAKRVHPDVNPSQDAKKEFIRINIAYEYLTNLRHRRRTILPKAKKSYVPKHPKPTANKEKKYTVKGERRAKRKLTEFQKKAAIRMLIIDATRGTLAILSFNAMVVFMLYLSYKSNDEFTYESYISLVAVFSSVILIAGGIIIGFTLRGTIKDTRKS